MIKSEAEAMADLKGLSTAKPIVSGKHMAACLPS